MYEILKGKENIFKWEITHKKNKNKTFRKWIKVRNAAY